MAYPNGNALLQAGISAPLVRGMPYATLLYSGLTPRLGFSGAVLSVSGGGRRHEVTLNNGQRWIVYSSGDIRCKH